MRTHDKWHARTHLHPRHRKQHLAPSTSTMEPRRWVTWSNRLLPVAAVANLHQSSRPPRQYLGGMLPARMSVKVVDEHHALQARKKVDPLPNSVLRAWIHVFPPGGCCDLNVFAAAPPSATTDSTTARPVAVRHTLRGRNHTLGKATLLYHKDIRKYLFFLWRTNRYWAEY